MNAVQLAALHRYVALSADIELQLKDTQGGGSTVAILVKAQQAAAEAIVQLATVEPEDPTAIRKWQTDLQCFHRICEWLREIIAAGYEAGDALDEWQRQDFTEVLGITEDDVDDVLAGEHP